MLGPVAKFVDLARQPRDVRFGALGLSPRRFERGLGHPPLGAHGRFARQQRRQVRLGLPRLGFGRGQLGRNPRRLRFAVGQTGPRWPRARGTKRVDRLAASSRNAPRERFLYVGIPAAGQARPVAGLRCRDAPSRRQLMRQRPPTVARLGQGADERASSAAACSCDSCLSLHRLLQRADRLRRTFRFLRSRACAASLASCPRA
jgi:hypothetical protein